MNFLRLGRHGSTRAQRVGSAALVVVLALLAWLAYGAVAVSTNAVRAETRARLRTTATVGAVVVQREMDGVSTLLQSFSRRPGLTSALALPDGPERESEIAVHLGQLSVANPGFAGVFITRLDGVLTDVVPRTPSIVGRSFAYRDWFAGVSRTGGPYVSEAYKTAILGQPLVVAVATYARVNGDPSGKPVAIVAIVYRLNSIRDFTQQVAKAQGVELTLADQHGLLLTDRGQATNEITKYKDGSRAGYLTESSDVASVGWSVRADLSQARALAPVRRLRWTVLAVVGLLAAAGGLGFGYVGWLLRRRRVAEAGRWEAEQRMTDIIEASNDAFVSIGVDGRIVEWNRQAESLLGWSHADALGTPIADLIVPERFREDHTRGLARYLATQEAHVLGQRLEVFALHRDGHEIPVEMSLWVSSHGAETRFSTFIHDISERQRYEQELLDLARTDPLTGVGNRLRMTEDLAALQERFIRYGQTYAIALIDVDHFKSYNDTYGHVAGDVALRAVAAELQRVLRGADAIYRYGGEEFVAVLPAQEPTGALTAAERLRGSIEALQHPHPASAHGVLTISVGVAPVGADGGSVDSTLRNADRALYDAKRAGRNTVQASAALKSTAS